MRYPGGKGKTFQHVVNLLPDHTTYIETHLGGGAVLRMKRPADRSIGIDVDPKVIAHWRHCHPGLADYRIADATRELELYPFTGHELVYADPPYMPTTRKRQRVYRYDYTEGDHARLLSVLLGMRCSVV
ncbi:MAG TPA: DNA adenine methylase, partial [Thermoanaerobaculia bacterium]|nr:DNA adenine methylase [Thermoanaerobaculia bacterium]